MKKKRGKSHERQQTPIARLRVMAEYESSGIWIVRQQGVFRHGMIDHGDLRLPQKLAERFIRWIELYEKQLTAPSEYDYESFNAEGRELARNLKRHVGSATHVEFIAETSEGGVSPSEEIL